MCKKVKTIYNYIDKTHTYTRMSGYARDSP